MAIIGKEVKLVMETADGTQYDLSGYVESFELSTDFGGWDRFMPAEHGISATFTVRGSKLIHSLGNPDTDRDNYTEITHNVSTKPEQKIKRLECGYCEQLNDLENGCCKFCGGKLRWARKVSIS